MFLIYLVNAFRSSITGNLGAYVVSGFEAHSLIPVISIVSSVMSAAVYMPLAKLLNLFDRSYGFLAMVAVGTIGIVLSAVCQNVETYCAAEVFTTIGFTGMIFSVDVITTDTSSLRDRGLAFAFTSSPYMITAFAGPAAAERFYADNWRWGYGTFAIVLPIVASPLFVVLQVNKLKAAKMGMMTRPKLDMSWSRALWYYTIEFDRESHFRLYIVFATHEPTLLLLSVLGVILLAGGLVLFLLPFSLASTTADSWRSASIISMLVIGVCCLLAFVVVERYVAPKPFIPFDVLVSRTVLSTCLLSALYQIAYYCWASYFTSFLQVVFDVSISQAGYINSTFDVVSGFWLLCVGYLIRRTGYFKWLWMLAIPLYILAQGLMIHFRRPDQSVGFNIMCQVFIAFAGGTMIICQQVSVLAASTHNNAAAMLALLGLFGNSGGAVGNTISGAIWTHSLPGSLQKYLPAESLPDWETIYESLDVQLSYPMGSPTRMAIIQAYAEAQKRMLIGGTAIMGLSLGLVFLVRNFKVSTMEQCKGVLF